MEFLRNKFIATIKIESFDNRIIIRFLIEKKSSVDKMDRQKKDSKEAWFGKNRFRGDNWRISRSRRGIHKERRGNQRLMHYTYWGNLRQVSALRLPPPSPRLDFFRPSPPPLQHTPEPESRSISSRGAKRASILSIEKESPFAKVSPVDCSIEMYRVSKN